MSLEVQVDPRIVRLTQGNADAYASGQVVAPAAGAVVASFSFPAAGSYSIYFSLSVSDVGAVGKRLDLQWTNALGTIVFAIIASAAWGSGVSETYGARVYASGHLIRAVVGVAGDPGSVYTASMAAWRMP